MLADFFAVMAPFLTGQTAIGDVECRLGGVPSGADSLLFYRELMVRNAAKILGEAHPAVRIVLERESPGSFRDLALAYASAQPPVHWDPNHFAAGLSSYLEGQRMHGGAAREICVEIADFHGLQHAAHAAPDQLDDGFEHRLFVRHYRYPVPAFVRAILGDRATPVPDPSPTTVIVHRSLHDSEVHLFHPTLLGLVALARRQGLPLPPDVAHLEPGALAAAERDLVRAGILRPARVLGEVGS